jgi:hypothetical protein
MGRTESQKRKHSSRKKAVSAEAKRELGAETISKTDPFGSYTGISEDGEKPVQDADDL